jgi:hypothetical protein
MSVNEDPSTWRLSTPLGIPFKWVNLTGAFGEEDSDATATVIIQSSRLLDFVVEGFPAPVIFGGAVFYPRRAFLGGLPTLTVKRISYKGLTDGRPIDPFGQDSSAPDGTYEPFLEVQITYGTTPQNDAERNPNDPFTFLEVSTIASGEFLLSSVRGDDNTLVEWNTSTEEEEVREEVKDIDINQPINQPLIEHNLRWTQIPFAWFNSILFPRLRLAMGRVNESTMPIFSDAPAETILFVGFSSASQFTWRSGRTGASPIALDLRFLEKNFISPYTENLRVTHNHMYHIEKKWARLEIDGNPLHELHNLNTIFNP